MIRLSYIARWRAWTGASCPRAPRGQRLRVVADAQNTKSLARAVKAVKVKVITVSKNNSKAADVLAGKAQVLKAECVTGTFAW